MGRPELILGRDGMGCDATEDDFDNWVSFVAEHIEEMCGYAVDVDEKRRGDVQTDMVVADEEAQFLAICNAKDRLWDEWCAGGAS